MPDTSTTQTVPYYELHRNFPDRYGCRSARRLGVPALTLTAYYAVMHDLASNAATFGEFSTDVRAFEEAAGAPERFGVDAPDMEQDARLARIWNLLARAELVELVGDPSAVDEDGFPVKFRVRVLGMAARPRKQTKSRAEIQKDYRNRQKSGASTPTDTNPLPNVTDEGNALPGDVTLRGSIQPSIQSIQPSKVSLQSYSDPSARPRGTEHGLTVNSRLEELDSGTVYEIERLVDSLRNADTGTVGVFAHLARQGASAADFADARAAIRECDPSFNAAGYAVRTIQNRLTQRDTG